MTWFKGFLGPHIVVVSEPYLEGESWFYIFGDEKKFRLRKFSTADEAHNNHRASLTGLRLGSAEFSIKLIELNAEQARAVALYGASYRETVALHIG